MPIIKQTQKAPEITPQVADWDRENIVASGAIREAASSQEEIISQYIKQEAREQARQETENFQEELHQTVAVTTPASSTPGIAAIAPTAEKSEFLLEIENILADGLGDIYDRLDPPDKIKFKNKGEEVARRIERVIAAGKIKIKQILSWIKSWLKFIPGVNRFFLEQEAKIKTDRVLALSQPKELGLAKT